MSGRRSQPGSQPGTTSKPGPSGPGQVDPLAEAALDRVVAESSELAELSDETPDGPRWRQNISSLRAVLAPGPEPQEDLLFNL
ncbi:DUF4259 domain-containing protein [Streptomyces sp. NPDC001939]